MLTQARVKEAFDYHPDGHLVWKNHIRKSCVGKKVGCILKAATGKQYLISRLDSKHYLVHRLIWIWHYGEIKKDQIDHIDGDGLNNKIENLREATIKENSKNKKLAENNKTGITGVGFHKATNKWISYIGISGKTKHLGVFKKFEDAKNARENANKLYFGEWNRLEKK